MAEAQLSETATEAPATAGAAGAAPRRSRGAWGLAVVLAVLAALTVGVRLALPGDGQGLFPAASAGGAGSVSSAPADEPGSVVVLPDEGPQDVSAASDAAADAPDPTPIESDGAGYATADSLLGAVSPGLFAALRTGTGDEAMAAWVANALGFAPPGLAEGWAAAEGADSAEALAALLADPEAARLAPLANGGALQLIAGPPASAETLAAVNARLAELGSSAQATAVTRVRVATSERPSDAAEDARSPQGLYEQDVPYLAVQCGDAWFFYPEPFVRRA